MQNTLSTFLLTQQKQMAETLLNPFAFQALISIILLITITKWLSKSTKSKNSPPSPPRLPILGHLHRLSLLPHHDLQSMARNHGPVMLIHFGSVPTLIASSAAAAAEIMKTHDLAFADRPDSSLFRRLLYDNKDVSVSPYGEYWRQLKSICVVQLLSNKRVQSFHSVRAEETEILIGKIGGKAECVDLSRMFTQLTNDVVCRSAIGRKYGDGGDGERFLSILREFLEVLSTISIGDFVPSLSWIGRFNGLDKRVDRVANEIDEFLESVIRERLDNPAERVVAGENFLDILLDIYRNNSGGVSIDRDSIKAIILDVFAAGTDTTATVLEWAMSELLRRPVILKRLQTEVREVAEDSHNITENDIERMHFLKAVMKETLRLHTPIPLLVPRVAREDVKIMGYDVAKGTMVMTNAWAIGRDPSSWDEPESFNPDRFLNSSVDYKGVDFELIPFGAGRRGCPGTAFAMATNEFVLANLVHRFDWKLPNNCGELDMSERPGVAIRRRVPLVAVAVQC
ncbi:cytochrome P450 71A8-like [Salvia splendens]|uniref:cytochrome P450 71A8-like n=1 Tax=Salvia splendens TaxID=180675 RepID=UPI001C27250B|nr:cytochrome P450 71A8-like [Salvia splendens]